MPLSFTPPPNEHEELENICKEIEHTPINIRKSKDNLMNLTKGLELLLEKISSNKIIIKPAEKGAITVVMTPKDYWNMCYRHLSDTTFYNNLDNNDPSTIAQDSVNKFAEKYKSILTSNQYDFLTKRSHKISNFYMLPKLHISKKINEIIEIKRTEYIQIDEDILVEGRPIVAGPVFHTSGISEILHCIMEPALSLIPHIVKDSFDFTQRLEKQCQNNTLLSTCDIKSLYTNIRQDLFLTAIEYWIEHLQNNLPLLQRFTKQVVSEGLSIILKFNYFYINKSFFHQIKGTAMGTKFAVVGSNLVVAYKEIKLFALLPQVYPQDFVDFLLRNYVRFLDDIFHKWLENFDIKQFYDLINSLDEDLKFIFENPSRTLNILDIQLKIVNNILVFDISYKPTNSFNYLTYSSRHPSHTKNNIALSLAKRSINIVTDNREKRLSELKNHLIERNYPLETIDYTFTKCFQPKLDKNKDLEKIIFTRTFNPNHVINLNKFTRSLENIRSNGLKQCFQNKTVQLPTRQPKNLRKILINAKFEEDPLAPPVKEVGFFLCNDCIYYRSEYFKPCKSFQFKVNNKSMI